MYWPPASSGASRRARACRKSLGSWLLPSAWWSNWRPPTWHSTCSGSNAGCATMWCPGYREDVMQLSSLLGMAVVDAGSHLVGAVIDVRVDITGDIHDHPHTPHLLGLVISPHTRASYLGYERSGADGPALIAA